MYLHIAVRTKAFVRKRSVRWNGAVQLVQPVMIAYNVSGVAGSLLALAGMLAVAARGRLVLALHQEAEGTPCGPYTAQWTSPRSR
jgi:hypothetical protein